MRSFSISLKSAKFQKIGSVRQYLDILRLGDFCPKTTISLIFVFLHFKNIIEKFIKKFYKLIFQSFLAVLKLDMSFFDFPGELWNSFLMKFFFKKNKNNK